MSDEKVILEDSPEAAWRARVFGWTSRRGKFFADFEGDAERMARHDGSTHSRCLTCGGLIEKSALCWPCNLAKLEAKLEAMPREEWDGTFPLYYDAQDEYILDDDYLDDILADLDEGKGFNDCQFQRCAPNHVGMLDPYDYCCDELPEDGEVPDEVAIAAKKFNEAVKDVVLSWSPINVVVTRKEEER